MGHPSNDPIRRTLLQQRVRLLAVEASTEAQEQALLAEIEPDWEDTAAHVTAARLLARLHETERLEVRAIDAALKRLREGSYGPCLGCAKPIPLARLHALPHASHCVLCAAANERVGAHA